jgi:hypothetical protein
MAILASDITKIEFRLPQIYDSSVFNDFLFGNVWDRVELIIEFNDTSASSVVGLDYRFR